MQKCIDALMRGDFDLSDQRFKDAADRHGKGKVDRRNLRKMYFTACETRKGQRPVSAALQAATEAEQCVEALKDCLDAASTAFTAREVSGWCMCRR